VTVPYFSALFLRGQRSSMLRLSLTKPIARSSEHRVSSFSGSIGKISLENLVGIEVQSKIQTIL